MASTIVLITGANRGLGLGLLQRYLVLPNHIVIAANRTLSNPKTLESYPKGEGSRLVVVKIDATVEKDAHDTVAELQKDHGIDHLDIVIANAGVSSVWPSVADLKISDLQAHMEPNVYGVVSLFQATRPLLKKSSREPIFTLMGSTAGCLENQPPITNGAYGPSKAAANWFGIRINAEEDWLNAFVLAPGWVQTDLGNAGARYFGLKEASIGVDESCDGMMEVLAKTTKEKHGGKMVLYNGETSGY
ncbi:hypothetical protein COL922a_007575 [Colletotrichum nupharicola]|nr:hypothetical protein COL922a_007575 [Colletotrichum nupharicola]